MDWEKYMNWENIWPDSPEDDYLSELSRLEKNIVGASKEVQLKQFEITRTAICQLVEKRENEIEELRSDHRKEIDHRIKREKVLEEEIQIYKRGRIPLAGFSFAAGWFVRFMRRI